MKEKSESLYDAIWPQGAPKREMRCSHCGRVNRLDVGKAALLMEQCRCGGCSELMFRTKDESLAGLHADMYQHPLDRSSLAALRSIPGASQVLKRFMGEIGEKPLRYQVLASSIQCGEEQFPELYMRLQQACDRLGIDLIPTLFLSQSPVINASTFGAEEPVIVVYSALLDHLDDAGVTTVLGHELFCWSTSQICC